MTDIMLTEARCRVGNQNRLAETTDVLTRVDQLLRENRPREALALLPVNDSPWIRNARGVCLLRLGRHGEAVVALRELVFGPGGLAVLSDADPLFQANYATALLHDSNAQGFWGILGGIGDRTHPAVVKLDEAVRRWKAGMTFGQRIALALGVGGPRFTLDFPPGDL